MKHAKVSVLIDTDILIDYFNTGRFHALFDSNRYTVYYSIIMKKELLTKPGLREIEREAILAELTECWLIPLSYAIASRYSDLRRRHPLIEKANAHIAASALAKQLPLLTKNTHHLRAVQGLTLFGM